MTPQQKIAQLESLNQELLQVIREFKQLTDHPEVSEEIQQKGADLYELSQTFDEIRDSSFTIDQWMGQYLLGAKAEVTRLLTEAVSLARIVSTPVGESGRLEVGEETLVLSNQTKTLADEAPQATPMSRLAEISERSNAQCAALMEELDQTVQPEKKKVKK